MFIKLNLIMVFFVVIKKKIFFLLYGSIIIKSLLNSLLVFCVFVKMNLFLFDSVDKKNWKIEYCFEYRYFVYLYIKILNFFLFLMVWRLNVYCLFYCGGFVRDNDDSILYIYFLLKGEIGLSLVWFGENLEVRVCCVK